LLISSSVTAMAAETGLASFYPGIGAVNTSHGSPWAYDTSVPILIAGPGIRNGVWTDPVTPADIAPTLSLLLGIAAPSGSDGGILQPALR
jgi:arylsulfatase A-like enzyme